MLRSSLAAEPENYGKAGMAFTGRHTVGRKEEVFKIGNQAIKAPEGGKSEN